MRSLSRKTLYEKRLADQLDERLRVLFLGGAVIANHNSAICLARIKASSALISVVERATARDGRGNVRMRAAQASSRLGATLQSITATEARGLPPEPRWRARSRMLRTMRCSLTALVIPMLTKSSLLPLVVMEPVEAG